MKKYKATYQVEVKDHNGDIIKRNATATVKADSYAEARQAVKSKYKGKNIVVEEMKLTFTMKH